MANYSANIPLSLGSHNIVVTATDGNGNVSNQNININIERINPVVIASYPFSEINDGMHVNYVAGQAITLPTCSIYSISLSMQRNGNPSGSVYGEIYACQGTPGVNGRPTGSPIAISEPVAESSILADVGSMVQFTFTTPVAVSGNICIAYRTPTYRMFAIKVDMAAPAGSGNAFSDFDSNTTYDAAYAIYGTIS